MLLNKKQIADVLQVSVRTIDNFMTDGMPYIKVGHQVRFETESVLEYFKKKKEVD